MSASNPAQADNNSRADAQSSFGSGESDFWPFVWIGIALAGALFGLLLGLTFLANEGFGAAIVGAGIGAFVGLLFAGIVAVPMVFTMAIASWAIGTRRWRTLLAIIAGGGTGVLSSLPIAPNVEELGFRPAATGVAIVVGAGLLGLLGGWIATLAWARRGGNVSVTIGEGLGCADVPVSNRCFRIGVLLAVIAVVVAVCLGAAGMVQHAREAARRDMCRNHLKQIWLCLETYERANRSLPPAYVTDKAGKPVLSWRVAVARFCYYDTDFSKWMDAGQPWNSPTNAKFLDGLSYFMHCPSSGKKPENPLTDYVAVVGPDTLWPGKLPGDRKQHPKGVFVVEWPKSDIHWAEPRDISVEEFLDWFRRKPPRRGFWDWLLAKSPENGSSHFGCLLYVDAEGTVGELRNDTDPDTVRKLLAGQSTVGAASPAPSRQ